MYVYIRTYIYIYMFVYTDISIHIYIEREKERLLFLLPSDSSLVANWLPIANAKILTFECMAIKQTRTQTHGAKPKPIDQSSPTPSFDIKNDCCKNKVGGSSLSCLCIAIHVLYCERCYCCIDKISELSNACLLLTTALERAVPCRAMPCHAAPRRPAICS